MQPPPRPILEHSAFGVDAVHLVQVKLDGEPMPHELGPGDRAGWGALRGGVGRGVPVADTGLGVVGPTTCVVRPVRPRIGVIGAVGAV